MGRAREKLAAWTDTVREEGREGGREEGKEEGREGRG
jgi:hypothetical protein